MKLGVLTVPLSSLSLEETMKFLSEQGVQTLEIGCGGFPGDAHLKPAEVLDGDAKAEEIKGLLKKYNLEICAISAHSNGVHPNQEVAAKAIEDFKNSVLVAEKLGVDTVLPGFQVSQLGDLPLAGRFSGNSGLAVEPGADSLLEKGSSFC